MNLGEPLRTIICTPEKLPIPDPEPAFEPDRREVEEPVEVPQKGD